MCERFSAGGMKSHQIPLELRALLTLLETKGHTGLAPHGPHPRFSPCHGRGGGATVESRLLGLTVRVAWGLGFFLLVKGTGLCHDMGSIEIVLLP